MSSSTFSHAVSDDECLADTVSLLRHYSFDMADRSVSEWLAIWLPHYAPGWIRLATIEALYRGRYKAVSVDQILQFWQRRCTPSFHFNREFERLVCTKFPRSLTAATSESVWEPLLPESEPETASWQEELASGYPDDTVPVAEAEESSKVDSSCLPEANDYREPGDRANSILAILASLEQISKARSRRAAESAARAEAEVTAIEGDELVSECNEIPLEAIAEDGYLEPTVELDASAVEVDDDSGTTGAIAQLAPLTGESNFYSRLKAVANQDDPAQTEEPLAG